MTAYKYGRLPAQFPGQLAGLSAYAAGTLPPPPAAISVPGERYPWGMLGNDTYGDCTVAGLQHLLETDSLVTGRAYDAPPAQQAIDWYLKYTGGQDTGAVISQLLAYARQHGYYGQTIGGYAPVNHASVTELRQCIAMFDACYTGIAVTQRMEDEFGAGVGSGKPAIPWTLESLDSAEAGLHCVPLIAYGSHKATLVTWAALQPVDWAAFVQMSDEAWAVLTGELDEGDGRGINYAQLTADLDKLG